MHKFIAIFCLLIEGCVAVSQNIYPSLSPCQYYNMDTSNVIMGERQIPSSYTNGDIQKLMSGELEDETFRSPDDLALCERICVAVLPIVQVKDIVLYNRIDNIVRRTLSGGFSSSPDTVKSRGVYFRIDFRQVEDEHTGTSNFMMSINVSSNYYLGSFWRFNMSNYPAANVYACYFDDVLGIISFDDESKEII